MPDALHSYRARWVIPVAGPPVEHGIVVVHGERIVGIHRTRRPDTVDLGDVAILPGLVNCHTHLEFSRLAEPLQPMSPFTDWIRAVVEFRRSGGVSPPGSDISRLGGETPPLRSSAPPTMVNRVGDAIRAGLDESLRGGVTLLGDIATSGWSWEDYQNGPDCVVFQELLGLSPERVSEAMASAERHRTHAGAGLSPHAPYSVHPHLFHRAVRLAKDAEIPLAMHLGETDSERELLAQGTGEFRALLEEFDLWRPELFGGRTWQEFLEPLSELSHALVIHGNYLKNNDLRFLAQHPQMALVYCPRTHAAFRHPPHPWQMLIQLGGSLALGTDSRASNPDLSLWAELQFLADHFPQVSHLDLVRLATSNGARALAHSRNHGSLETGKLANLVVVGPVPDDGPELHRSLIHPASQITRVMHRGRWIT